MNYKHSCVVDAKFIYKTLVLVLLTQADQGEEQEWKVQVEDHNGNLNL